MKIKIGKVFSTEFANGTLKKKWIIALQDPIYWMIWFITAFLLFRTWIVIPAVITIFYTIIKTIEYFE